jgi:hypothetical protein
LHDDTVGNELEISVDCGNILENLISFDIYVITDLIRPNLSIVNVVVFISEMAADDVVHLLLNEGADVVEHCLFLLTHMLF